MDVLLLFFCFSCFLWVTTFPPLWRFKRSRPGTVGFGQIASADRALFPRDARALRRPTVFLDQPRDGSRGHLSKRQGFVTGDYGTTLALQMLGSAARCFFHAAVRSNGGFGIIGIREGLLNSAECVGK